MKISISNYVNLPNVLNEGEFLYQIAHLILLYFNQLEEF